MVIWNFPFHFRVGDCQMGLKAVSMNAMRFHEKLKKILDERDLHQTDLARETGMSTGTVNRWIHGQIDPQFGHVVRIADYLDVSLDELADDAVDAPGVSSRGSLSAAELHVLDAWHRTGLDFIDAVLAMQRFADDAHRNDGNGNGARAREMARESGVPGAAPKISPVKRQG